MKDKKEKSIGKREIRYFRDGQSPPKDAIYMHSVPDFVVLKKVKNIKKIK